MSAPAFDYFLSRQFFKLILLILIGVFIGNFYSMSKSRINDSSCVSKREPKSAIQSIEVNLILSVTIGLPLLNVYRFIRTARSTCNDCHIVIFTNDPNNADYKHLAFFYNVTFLSYDQYRPKDLKNLNVYSLRFLIYHIYLSDEQYDHIYICDLRDTLFQRNIFQQMKFFPHVQLFAFMESEQITIGQCKLHNHWIASCYGQDALMPIYNRSRSCAGSILGTYKGIMKYLSLMKVQIMRNPACNDQGIHNYLLYYQLNDTTTMQVTHETGFLGTLGTTQWVYRNKYGLVLNKNSQVYAVVHQFDHSQQVKQQIEREYQILPDNILMLKN